MPLPDTARSLLSAALGLAEGDSPFPWQAALLQRFIEEGSEDRRRGTVRALDLPTGLGKTSVMAIWLVARALGAKLPRRLVYIVDRRAVVDQATDVALGLRNWLATEPTLSKTIGLNDRTTVLPISTLRGQYADNREWLSDPSAPAILVGTVDMIGSKLLFEGYGTSRKMRPYHAGLLGADALFVLDEAHLVPPFERLLEQVVQYTADNRSRAEAEAFPPIRLLSLSATGRDHGENTFGLTKADLEHPEVLRRLNAPKRLQLLDPVPQRELAAALAQQAWQLASRARTPVRCIIFCRRRADAERALKELSAIAKAKRGKSSATISLELFVGARRVRERQAAAVRLKDLGFLAGSSNALVGHAFLFATSAGEVGVDLDADHMVADVVAWERMVQRLGRVNRRGRGDAAVLILPVADPDGGQAGHDEVVELLSALPRGQDGSYNANAIGLDELKLRQADDIDFAQKLIRASTPDPLYPALNRPLLDAWAMTSLKEHTGRPEVAPWLRGWQESRPQTNIVFRAELGLLADQPDPRVLADYLAAAPPHLTEQLDVDTTMAVDWLLAVVKRFRKQAESSLGCCAVVLDQSCEISETMRLDDPRLTDSRARKRLFATLAARTLVVDAGLGGLSSEGLLLASAAEPAIAADRGSDDATWLPDADSKAPSIPWRVRRSRSQAEEVPDAAKWQERARFGLVESDKPDANVTEWVVVERWRQDAATEDERSTASQPQKLEEHQAWAADRARTLCEQLELPPKIGGLIDLAAQLHDEGKRAKSWQDAFSAPDDGAVYAKTKGPVFPRRLHGYRHEFGSLPYAERHSKLAALGPEERDLVLHLIAAHHGHARPFISWFGGDELPSKARVRAAEVALRFTRVQEHWGPWGLAYLEALLRAADQQASRDNDEGARE